MSDTRQDYRSDIPGRMAGRSPRRRLGASFEWLETRSLLSVAGITPPVPLPAFLTDQALVDRPKLGPQFSVDSTTFSLHPDWAILDVVPHGNWDEAPRLLLPALAAGQIPTTTFSLLQDAARTDSAPPDVLIRHLADDPHILLATTLPGEDRGEALRLSPGRDGGTLFRVTVNVPPEDLAHHPAATGQPTPHAEALLDLFGGSGEFYGQLPMPRPGTGFSLLIRANPTPDGSIPTLVLGIARSTGAGDTPSLATSPPLTFSISVDRSSAPTTGSGTGGLSSRPEVDVGSLAQARWTPSPKIDADSMADGPSLDAETNTVPAIGVGQSTSGVFPLRGAGPSGGVLADGESAPEISPLDGAIVDLTLMELSPEVALKESEEERNPLATVVTSSGFPILVAAATLPMTDPEDGLRDLALTKVDPVIADPRREEEPETEATSTPIALGVGAVAGLTFGILLPDVIARLAPRAAGKPRPRWGRRSFWKPLAPK